MKDNSIEAANIDINIFYFKYNFTQFFHRF